MRSAPSHDATELQTVSVLPEKFAHPSVASLAKRLITGVQPVPTTEKRMVTGGTVVVVVGRTVVVVARTVVVGASVVVVARTVVVVARTVVAGSEAGALFPDVGASVVVVARAVVVGPDADFVVVVVVAVDAGFAVVVEPDAGFPVVVLVAIDVGVGFAATVVLGAPGGAVTGPVGALSTIAT